MIYNIYKINIQQLLLVKILFSNYIYNLLNNQNIFTFIAN